MKKTIALLFILLLSSFQGCLETVPSTVGVASSPALFASGGLSNNQSPFISTVDSTSEKINPSAPSVEFADFIKIFINDGSSFGLTKDGVLYSWGNNDRGCLGLSAEDEIVNQPLKIDIPEKVIDLAPGALCVAIDENGNVYTWGLSDLLNSDGEFAYDSTPKQKELPEAISEIFQAHGMVGLAKGVSGKLYIWGWNGQGQLFGTTEEIWSSVPITAQLPAEVVMVCGYDTHLIALCTDGKVYTWGSNYYGELGDGFYIKNNGKTDELIENNRSYAAAVALDGTVVRVAAGRGASYALLDDGTVYAWGVNDVGQLGVGKNVTASSTPIKIDFPEKITSIVSNAFTAYAISESGKLYGWGKNSQEGTDTGYTGLGISGGSDIVYTPVQIPVPGTVTSVQAGFATFASTADGHLWVWGSNLYKSISADIENFPKAPIMLY